MLVLPTPSRIHTHSTRDFSIASLMISIIIHHPDTRASDSHLQAALPPPRLTAPAKGDWRANGISTTGSSPSTVRNTHRIQTPGYRSPALLCTKARGQQKISPSTQRWRQFAAYQSWRRCACKICATQKQHVCTGSHPAARLERNVKELLPYPLAFWKRPGTCPTWGTGTALKPEGIAAAATAADIPAPDPATAAAAAAARAPHHATASLRHMLAPSGGAPTLRAPAHGDGGMRKPCATHGWQNTSNVAMENRSVALARMAAVFAFFYFFVPF